MKFRPLRDMLVIKRTKTSYTSAGGIDLSGATQEKPTEGIVLAAGPGKYMENGELCEMAIKEGDTVLFGASVGVEVNIDNSPVLMLREEDIMGILPR